MYQNMFQPFHLVLLLLGIYSKEREYNKGLFVEIIITVTCDVENSQTVSNIGQLLSKTL